MGVIFEGYLQHRWDEHSRLVDAFFAIEGANGSTTFLVLYPPVPADVDEELGGARKVGRHGKAKAGSAASFGALASAHGIAKAARH